MQNITNLPLQDEGPASGTVDITDSAAPSIYLMYRPRTDLDWFGEENYEIEVAALDRFLGRRPGKIRRSEGRLYAFWRWPVYDAGRIERLIYYRFISTFGRPFVGRHRFLVPDVERAYEEIAGILDKEGVKVSRSRPS